MLIAGSAVSLVVLGLPGRAGMSVVCGPRPTVEGPRTGRSGSFCLVSRWVPLVGQRGPGAGHRPACGRCGWHGWRENRSLSRGPVGHHGQAGCPDRGTMTTPEHGRGSPARKGAVLLALGYYGRQMARLWRFTVPAMLLPALGNTCIFYVAPLIVAQLVGRFAGHGPTGIGAAMPYVIGVAGVLLFAEVVWRIGIHSLIRLEGHGIEKLYVIGMDELLAKDAAFFHDSFAGSLTKQVLSFASRFEDFTDNLVFNIVGSLVPLAFASVVLWRYDPLLVAGLIGLIAITGAGIAPLIRRRQKLVDQREEAIARVSGHVADSLMNMDTIRAFAAEEREAAEHRSRVADQRRKSLRSWDYENLRIDTL